VHTSLELGKGTQETPRWSSSTSSVVQIQITSEELSIDDFGAFVQMVCEKVDLEQQGFPRQNVTPASTAEGELEPWDDEAHQVRLRVPIAAELKKQCPRLAIVGTMVALRSHFDKLPPTAQVHMYAGPTVERHAELIERERDARNQQANAAALVLAKERKREAELAALNAAARAAEGRAELLRLNQIGAAGGGSGRGADTSRRLSSGLHSSRGPAVAASRMRAPGGGCAADGAAADAGSAGQADAAD
jgi:hypothetical protein